MASENCLFEDTTQKFLKLSLHKPNKAKSSRSLFSVDSKINVDQRNNINVQDKENYPRCKASLTFGTPLKSVCTNTDAHAIRTSPKLFADDLEENLLKLQDFEDIDEANPVQSVLLDVSSDDTLNLSDDDDLIFSDNNLHGTQSASKEKHVLENVITPTKTAKTKKTQSSKKDVDALSCRKVLCELYGRECLSTPGLFKKISLKHSVDEKISKVLDFNSCDDDVPEPLFETPVKPYVPHSTKTEQKSKTTICKTKSKCVALQDIKKYDFVHSLAEDIPMWRCNESALMFKNQFKQKKTELMEKLFKVFSETVFDSRLLLADIPVTWDKKLQRTAGIASNVKHRDGTRSSSIRLSEKVISNTEMLRNTLIHEMCHSATWIIDGERNAGHGPIWKRWANVAMHRYPLVKIERCHRYKINYKYTYKCLVCRLEIGRQSKSIKEQMRCGVCHGKFELLVNRHLKSGAVLTTPASQAKAGAFALYVREYYGTVKREGRSHGEIMKILGRQFALLKSAGMT